jgi:hypothetical protein
MSASVSQAVACEGQGRNLKMNDDKPIESYAFV